VATSGPVAILAGAGTGKTRVSSHRAAYAIATGVVAAHEVLVVTFTDKAAAEMADRLRRLGQPGVTARTFHAHALSQLRHFWPGRHEGSPPPAILESKLPIVTRIARSLPGGYRFTPARDLASEVEWAKNRRIAPSAYLAEATAAGRTAPIPLELMGRAFADYERAKARAGRIDFEDMLGATIDLLEGDAAAAALVRARKRWFSVDEYQDTNPLQERLLELWAGSSRDVCVVGDEDQTIYSFTGASSRYLQDFARNHPGTTVVALTENYRSSPEILALANRLIAGPGRRPALVATRPSGPPPSSAGYADADAELAGLVRGIRTRLGEGTDPAEVAVLVRINAQLAPIEAALTTAGIAYVVRGGRFYERPDVRAAIRAIERAGITASGPGLAVAVEALFASAFGFDPGSRPTGSEERERAAALEVLLAITRELPGGGPGTASAATAADLLAELARRDAGERAGTAGGLTLSTIHRAKGLEWDAVFLPGLEEGNLPIGQASGDAEAVAEERRLLYVALTRARRFLAVSWAARRDGPGGREGSRRPLRFLAEIGLGPDRARAGLGGARPSGLAASGSDRASDRSPRRERERAAPPSGSEAAFEALRSWRGERARNDGVPAYVIAPDATLLALLEARPRPRSAAELARVPGLGPARIERYGAEILAVLARS
jgi:DNA helicase II / ATP-dependent DNA helicase PcrA